MLLNIPSYHSNLYFKGLISFPLTFYNFELLDFFSLTHFVIVIISNDIPHKIQSWRRGCDYIQ